MSPRSNRKSPPAPAPATAALPPTNAFHDHFLRQAERHDEPPTATEAEFAGPWQNQLGAHGHTLLRSWEDLHRGDLPFATFTDEQTAQLALALLPARGRLATYRLSPQPDAEGFLIHREGQPIGHLAHFDEHFVEALSALEAVIKNPPALANLLLAAGPTALEQTGRILSRRMEEAIG